MKVFLFCSVELKTENVSLMFFPKKKKNWGNWTSWKKLECSKPQTLKYEFFFIYCTAGTIKISHKFKYCFSQIKWVFFEKKRSTHSATKIYAIFYPCNHFSPVVICQRVMLQAKRSYRTEGLLQQQGRVLKTEKSYFLCPKATGGYVFCNIC